MEMIVILALAFGAMWLMTSRTRKQQKKAASFRSNLAPGQEVMTGSGLFGTIVEVEDEVVTLETSPGVTSRWLRPAIAKLVEPPVVDESEDDEDAEYEDAEYEDAEYEDAEYDEAEATEDESTSVTTSGLSKDDEPQVPDDASSLTQEPGDEDRFRR